MDAFVNEINERPLHKVTVTDLVKACGINRNTFYYYFHDIYALASAVLERGIETVLAKPEQPVRFSEISCRLADYAQKNRRLVCHICDSDHKLVEQHVFAITSRILRERMRIEAEDLHCEETTREQLADFYAYALTGNFLQWLNRGMREPLSDAFAEIGTLLEDSPRAILESAARKPVQEKAG